MRRKRVLYGGSGLPIMIKCSFRALLWCVNYMGLTAVWFIFSVTFRNSLCTCNQHTHSEHSENDRTKTKRTLFFSSIVIQSQCQTDIIFFLCVPNVRTLVVTAKTIFDATILMTIICNAIDILRARCQTIYAHPTEYTHQNSSATPNPPTRSRRASMMISWSDAINHALCVFLWSQLYVYSWQRATWTRDVVFFWTREQRDRISRVTNLQLICFA